MGMKAGRKAKTLKERAAEMGVSVSTLKRRLKKAREEEPASGGGDEALGGMSWKERRERAQALKEERILEILDGEYYPKAVIDGSQAEVAFVVNAFVRAVETELPPLVAGLSPAAVEKQLKKWTPMWVAKLRDGEEKVWQAARAEVARTVRGDLKKVAEARARKEK